MNFQYVTRALASATRARRFLSVGVGGAIVDNVVLVLLVETLALQPTMAKVVSAEAAILAMFAANEAWTFSDFGEDGPWNLIRRLVTSNVIRSGGALVALATVFVLHGQFGVWYLAANVTGIGLGFALNYVFESLFTWQVG